MTARRLPGVAIASIASLTLVACSGGDDDASSATADTVSASAPATTVPSTTAATSTTPTAEAATTAAPSTTEAGSSQASSDTSTDTASDTGSDVSSDTSSAAPASEAELAQLALFTAEDFASDWTEEPYDASEDPDNEGLLSQIATCSGLDVDLISADGLLGDTKAKSSKFESPDETMSVEQTLGFAADLETALAGMAEIGNPALAPCYEQAISAAFTEPGAMPEGMQVGEVSMEPVDITGQASPDEVVWYSVLVPLTFQEQNLDQHLELLFLRTGRVMTQLELLGTGAPFPDEALNATIELALAKARAIDDTGSA